MRKLDLAGLCAGALLFVLMLGLTRPDTPAPARLQEAPAAARQTGSVANRTEPVPTQTPQDAAATDSRADLASLAVPILITPIPAIDAPRLLDVLAELQTKAAHDGQTAYQLYKALERCASAPKSAAEATARVERDIDLIKANHSQGWEERQHAIAQVHTGMESELRFCQDLPLTGHVQRMAWLERAADAGYPPAKTERWLHQIPWSRDRSADAEPRRQGWCAEAERLSDSRDLAAIQTHASFQLTDNPCRTPAPTTVAHGVQLAVYHSLRATPDPDAHYGLAEAEKDLQDRMARLSRGERMAIEDVARQHLEKWRAGGGLRGYHAR